MKKNFLIVGMIGALLTVTSCGTAEHNEAKMENKIDNALEDVRAGKEEATKDLRELREDVAVELTRIEEKLKDPAISDADRVKWEADRKDVSKQMSRLDDNLKDVESATKETWNDVKRGTEETTKDVGNWFQREAEKIDKHTKVDHDKDGH